MGDFRENLYTVSTYIMKSTRVNTKQENGKKSVFKAKNVMSFLFGLLFWSFLII
jgi:hypothetical protein